jgi:hypothetical protein
MVYTVTIPFSSGSDSPMAWVLEELQELKMFHPIALVGNLQQVWNIEGNYWMAISAMNVGA